ncbi:uncharacterized protein [Bemisia tabaci]|uniref:uncharacterized protein n=1 Tax=Bemisia tabaci TaxID=7038 RepID=UPI003B2873BF
MYATTLPLLLLGFVLALKTSVATNQVKSSSVDFPKELIKSLERERECQNNVTELEKQVIILNHTIEKELAKNAQLENKLQKFIPYLAIRYRIELFETVLAPELKQTPDKSKLVGMTAKMQFHTKTCHAVLSKKNHSLVEKTKKLLEKYNLTQSEFCDALGSFFVVGSDKIHTPPITKYTKEEINSALKDIGMDDPILQKSVYVLYDSLRNVENE